MRRMSLAASLLALIAPFAVAADGDPGANAAMLAISTVPPTGATASVRGDRVNVRFAPNRGARVVCSLPMGAVVDLIERVPNAAGWWAIRFPREGKAWAFTANLKPLDGNLLAVTREGTRAREDATQGAPIVRELALGEIVEAKGATVGQFTAVWIPNAVAYVHESVITLGAGAEGIITQSKGNQALADQEWQDAARLYLDLYREVQADLSRSTTIDWAPLTARLDRVIANHPDSAVRLKAAAIKSGVAEVQKAAAGVGGAPVPSTPVTPTPGTTIAVEPVKPGTTPAPLPTAAEIARIVQVPPKPKFVAQGMLETHDYPQLGAAHHLIDGNGQVVAILKPAAGASVGFSEFVWREVGANGPVTLAAPEQTGLAKPVPVVEVSELALGR